MELKRTVYPLTKAIEIINTETKQKYKFDDFMDFAYNGEIKVCIYLHRDCTKNKDNKIKVLFEYGSDQKFTNNVENIVNEFISEKICIPINLKYCCAFTDNVKQEYGSIFSANLLSCSLPVELNQASIISLINSNNELSFDKFILPNDVSDDSYWIQQFWLFFHRTITVSPAEKVSLSDLMITAEEIIRFISTQDGRAERKADESINLQKRSDFIRFLLGTNKYISNEALKSSISTHRLLILLKEAEETARKDAINSQPLKRFFSDTEYKTPNYRTLSKYLNRLDLE